MTKKDYVMISDNIRTVYESEKNMLKNEKATRAIEILIQMLSKSFKNDNPKFNQYIFERACGITNN